MSFTQFQVRSVPKYGHTFGGHRDEVTCGGNALKFYAAVRMRLVRMGLLKTDDKVNNLLVSNKKIISLDFWRYYFFWGSLNGLKTCNLLPPSSLSY